MTARDLVAMRVSGELYAVEAARPVEEAIRVMSDHDFSQISITRNGRVIGSLNESHLYKEFVKNPDVKRKPVEAIMQPAFPFVDISTPVGAAVDDDHAGEPGGAGPRLQDGEELHHHPVGHHPRVDVSTPRSRPT